MNTTNSQPSATTWTLDPAHSSVSFSVRHLLITTVRGDFQRVSGTVRYDGARPHELEIRADIPASSIHTRVDQRDAHLRSPDFFDADNHPLITFRSKGVKLGDGGKVEVTGDLTIRGLTRDVTLAVSEITGQQKDHLGKTRIGASATATFKRSDFGMTYNRVLEAGHLAIADDIAITLDASLVQDDAS